MADVKVYGNIMKHIPFAWKLLPFQIYRFCWWRFCTLPVQQWFHRDCSMTCGIRMPKLEFKPIFFSPEIVYLWQKNIRECNHFTMVFLWSWAPSKKTSIFPHHPIFLCVWWWVLYYDIYLHIIHNHTDKSATNENQFACFSTKLRSETMVWVHDIDGVILWLY